MPADLTQLREQLAARVGGSGGPAVQAALATVPRHLFLPGVPPADAYQDEAIVTRRDAAGMPVSSSSQPAIMAIMLAQLGLSPGHRVLEIGAGTGYNAALISEIAGPSGRVVSVDIDPEVAEEARDHLAAAGYPDVIVFAADGAGGAASHAPFDRLIATVGVADLSPAWLSQVTPDGRIVVPLDVRGTQLSVAFERAADGHWASRSVAPCGFMRMRGSQSDPTMVTQLEAGLWLALPEEREVTPLPALADPPSATEGTGVSPAGPDVSWGLRLWLAVHEARACQLTEEVRPGRQPRLPRPLFQSRSVQFSYGIVADAGGIAILTRDAAGELIAEGHGEAGAALVADLAEHVRAWHASGGRGTEGLHVDAYPRAAAGLAEPVTDGIVIERPSTRFVVYHT
ncbi:MAG TPA: methyltransferase domain-containing protein [Streptosporangiaceae bacterium]|nr:methyltransferase domain-containing protein [Streptosporangiaceae bacterium]